MSWIDKLFNSSLIIYAGIAFFILHIYLKRTKQTLPELITRIREAFQGAE